MKRAVTSSNRLTGEFAPPLPWDAVKFLPDVLTVPTHVDSQFSGGGWATTWTEIMASTAARPFEAWGLIYETVIGNNQFDAIEIAYGPAGSEVIVAAVHGTITEHCPFVVPVLIPPSQRIAVRCSHTSNSGTMRPGIYGVYR